MYIYISLGFGAAMSFCKVVSCGQEQGSGPIDFMVWTGQERKAARAITSPQAFRSEGSGH